MAYAQQKFDARGQLTDDETRARLRTLLEALVTWTQRCRQVPDAWLVGSR